MGTPMDVVSLFAGIGGIDEAARQAGMTSRLACEVDKPCRAVLAARFPEAVIHDDVRTLTADDIHRSGAVPARTVLTAGWPCQGNSVAGRRQGMADERSGLWSEVARVLAEFRPAWFVGENVPGLLSVNDGRDFGTVIGDLGELGYGFAWRVLDAQHFGVPQRRRRVVIVGHLGDTGAAPAEVLLEPESSGRDHPPLREAGETVAGTLGGGSGARGWAPDTDRMTFVPVKEPIAFAWQAGGNNSSSGAFNDDGTTPTLPKSQTLAVAFAENQRGEVLTSDVASSLKTGGGKPGQGYPAVAVALRGRDGGATAELGDDVSNALRASQGGGDKAHALVADQVRRLTPLECERLQGFPEGWTDVPGTSDSQRYKQLGNSVAVPVFAWVLRRLAAAAVAASLGAAS